MKTLSLDDSHVKVREEDEEQIYQVKQLDQNLLTDWQSGSHSAGNFHAFPSAYNMSSPTVTSKHLYKTAEFR